VKTNRKGHELNEETKKSNFAKRKRERERAKSKVKEARPKSKWRGTVGLAMKKGKKKKDEASVQFVGRK
jgi:hypothetical protein